MARLENVVRGSEVVGNCDQVALSRMLSASLSATFEKRTLVCSFRLGESESQRTTAFSSGMRLRSSSPKKSASIVAAHMTVLPDPVGDARHIEDSSPSCS